MAVNIAIEVQVEVRKSSWRLMELKIELHILTPILVKTRRVCWDLHKRGAVGETILHLCFLNATEIHNELAKRIIEVYPLLVNDIHHTDMYYGKIRG